MKVYSSLNEKDSLLAEKGISVKIPGGSVTDEDDWYPFVMTFNADSRFASFTGHKNDRLTIMYNFPSFDISKGCSRLYDNKSPYYNGFYGAYAVNGTYGFNDDGSFNTEYASKVCEFDMRKLVLEDMGMSSFEGIFEWDIAGISKDVSYAGYDGWTQIDADMLVNGTLHTPLESCRNYLQYGKPEYDVGKSGNFAPVAMKGRIYAKYFEEKDVSIYFYIMSRTPDILENCDRNILSESMIIFQ